MNSFLIKRVHFFMTKEDKIMMKYLIITLLFLLTPSPVMATIDIVPQKIVIEARDRGGELTILNLFNETGTFRINLINYEQNNNGIYKKLKTPLNPDFDPNKIVRFSPRQFSLPPGGRQKIRLSLRKPSDLPEGEYRFHVQAYRFANTNDIKEGDNAVRVLMNTGVVIPVVVRHGKTHSDAKIRNARLVNKGDSAKKELHVDILREGTASTIGKIEVLWKKSNAEKEKIGEVSNANIFTDINKRQFKIPLHKVPPEDAAILVRYYNDNKTGKIFDEVVVGY